MMNHGRAVKITQVTFRPMYIYNNLSQLPWELSISQKGYSQPMHIFQYHLYNFTIYLNILGFWQPSWHTPILDIFIKSL